jgi:hypothetical protein
VQNISFARYEGNKVDTTYSGYKIFEREKVMMQEEFVVKDFAEEMAEDIPDLLDRYSEELAMVILISGINDCLVFVKECCMSEFVANRVLGISKELSSTFIYDRFAISCDHGGRILKVLKRNNGVNGDRKEISIPIGYYFHVIPISLIGEVEELANIYRQEKNEFKISVRTL